MYCAVLSVSVPPPPSCRQHAVKRRKTGSGSKGCQQVDAELLLQQDDDDEGLQPEEDYVLGCTGGCMGGWVCLSLCVCLCTCLHERVYVSVLGGGGAELEGGSLRGGELSSRRAASCWATLVGWLGWLQALGADDGCPSFRTPPPGHCLRSSHPSHAPCLPSPPHPRGAPLRVSLTCSPHRPPCHPPSACRPALPRVPVLQAW